MCILILIVLPSIVSSLNECVKQTTEGSCLECLNNWVLAETMCFSNFCPTGYTQIINCEKSEDLSLFDLEFSKNFKPEDFASNFLYENAPIITENQGLYFSQNSWLIPIAKKILGPIFSISMWVNPENDGKMIEYINKNLSFLVLSIENSILYLKIDSTSLYLQDFSENSEKNWLKLTLNLNFNHKSCDLSLEINEEFTYKSFRSDFFPRYDSYSYWVFGGSLSGSLYSLSISNRFMTDSFEKFPGFAVFSELSSINQDSLLKNRVLSISCNYGYYLEKTSNLCLKCNSACLDCNGPNTYNCLNCGGAYKEIEGICMSYCPLGYAQYGNTCVDITSNGVVYELDLTQLTNTVQELAKVSSTNMVITAGNSSNFYPNFDYFDPYPVKDRGFYFTGHSYLTNGDYLLVFGPVFTLAMWLKPLQSYGCIMAKQYFSTIYLSLCLNSLFPTFSIKLASLQNFTANNPLESSSWNFVMVQLNLTQDFSSQIAFYVNSQTSTSGALGTYYTDLTQNFQSTIGAEYSGSVYFNFYEGFVYSYVLYNSLAGPSQFIQSEGCLGCSICPLNNNNSCISSCNLTQYINNVTKVCTDCSPSCTSFGCVRDDNNCNLCKDIICYECQNFLQGCIHCVNNAYLPSASSESCVCDYNYVWSENLEKCVPCSVKCLKCDGGGYLGCSQCVSGYYLSAGVCVSQCATGFKVAGVSCVLIGGSQILNLTLDKIQAIIYDSASQIPVIAGNGASFYPYYDVNDPVASVYRGYYFGGNDLMHFAPYLTYFEPFLAFAPITCMGFWINPSSANSVIFSEVDGSDYSIVVEVQLFNAYPELTLHLLLSSQPDSDTYPSHLCSNPVSLHNWNYVAFTINLDNQENTYVQCFVNGLSDPNPVLLGQGHFDDQGNGNVMLLGNIQTSATGLSNNGYKGFLYSMVVDTNLSNVNSGITSNCQGSCAVCFTNNPVCLPVCNISEYPVSSNFSQCFSCNSSCSELGCRNSDPSCNLCEDPTCLICSDFSGNCSSYKCDSGQFKLQGMTNCQSCDSSCKECKGAGPLNCTSCGAGVLLEGVCYPYCPTGYLLTSGTCSLELSEIVNLNLQQISAEVVDSQSYFNTIAGGNYQTFYPNFTYFDPWPIQDRGYYFNGHSYLQFPPNELVSLYLSLGYHFTITAWVKQSVSGTLFAKQDSSNNSVVLLDLSSKISFSLKFSSILTTASNPSLNSTWTYIGVSLDFLSNGSSLTTFYFNGKQDLTAVISNTVFIDVLYNFQVTIGALRSNLGFTDFWTGFLYKFSLFSQSIIPTDISSSCGGSTFVCNLCPKASNCLNTCPHNTFYNGFECQNCEVCAYESCVRDDKSCNLCNDIKCLVCSSFDAGTCSKCKPNATLNQGQCSCNTSYVWDNAAENCVFCDPLHKVVGQGACLDSCPTGYLNVSGSCEGTPGKIFEVVMDKIISGDLVDTINGKIVLRTGNSQAFYPTYDFFDPYATKDRGYYFNGVSSYMSFLNGNSSQNTLVFSPQFAIGFWLFPLGSGVILAKQSQDSQLVIIEISHEFYLNFSMLIDQTTVNCTSNVKVTVSAWNYVGVSTSILTNSNTQAFLFINQYSFVGQTVSNSPFSDFFTTFTCLIGAKYSGSLITNFFSGTLYSISIWNTNENLASQYSLSCGGSCAICPLTGTCIPACLLTYYDSLPNCQSCSSPCSKGCVRGTDCNLCYDRLCNTCKDYSSSGCMQCVDGAVFVNGICNCTLGVALQRPNGDLYCSSPCMSSCSQCNSSSNGDCLACINGFYLSSGFCLENCQLGYSAINSQCTPLLENALVVKYTFNALINDPLDSISGLKAFMGSTENYTYNYDINDPIPAYSRGIFFSGNQKYVCLPNNTVENRSIYLGNSHSMSIWINPGTSSQKSCVLSKEDSIFQYVFIDFEPSSLVLSANYLVLNTKTSEKSILTVNSSMSLNIWQQIVVTFSIVSTNSVVYLYVNGIAKEPQGIANTYLSEPKSVSFKLGFSQLKMTSFLGFIYEFEVFNYAILPSVPAKCACGACTSSGDCLSACPFLTYESGNACLNCSNYCTNGCITGQNCYLNQDPLCVQSTTFSASNCTQCTALASLTLSGCQCGTNALNLGTTCECTNLYENFNNLCVSCLYHIQSQDITSFFTADYLSVQFDFAHSLKSTTPSSCNYLFDPVSLSKFGNSPECTWTNDYKTLVVTLGNSATVLNETVTFNINTLTTDLQICGSNYGPTSTLIAFKFTFPLIQPTSVISAPFNYYIYCGDLEITGALSSGGYNRPLQYYWNIISNPFLPIFNAYLNRTDLNMLHFYNVTLTPTEVSVILIVRNWLGFQGTSSQNISISAGIGITLNLDQSIKWQMTVFDSKSIYVEATSDCQISTSLEYTWNLVSSHGNDSYVNSNLLWSSQKVPSKLYIPAGSLGPGSYIFGLSVYDTVIQQSGHTQLQITIDYSDLHVIFNPSHTTLNVNNGITLDGSVAVDPNNLNLPVSYLWSCFNSSDCSHIISDPTAQSPTVPANLLVPDTGYLFTLTFTKGHRKASGTLNVLTTSKSVGYVVFSPIPKYVNIQENFVIFVDLLQNCNCTYLWSQISGPYLNMSKIQNFKDLGIESGLLQAGQSYVVQLSVNNSGTVSYYSTSFQTDLSPVSGTFYTDQDSGTEDLTVFKLEAPGWVDAKDPNLAVTYQFGYYLNQKLHFLNMRNESSAFYTKLPSGNIQLFVRVYDSYNMYTESFYNVSVKASDTNITIFLSEINALLSYSWIDPDALPGLVNYLSILYEKLPNTTEVFNTSLNCIDKLQGSLINVDSGKIDVLLQLLLMSVPNNASESEMDLALTRLSSFTQLITDYDIIVSAPRAQKYLDVINASYTFNYSTVVYQGKVLSNINEIIKNLIFAASPKLAQGQSLLFGNDSIIAYSILLSGNTALEFSTLPALNSDFVSLPYTPSLQFNSSTTILSIVTLYNALPDYNTFSEYSSAIEFSFYYFSNLSQITADLGQIGLNISIPIYNSKSTPNCAYWDLTSEEWSTSGCDFETFVSDLSICNCNHMSLYTSSSLISSNSKPRSYIIVHITWIIAVLWVVIGLFLHCKDSDENEAKVFVENALAAMPPVMEKKSFKVRPNTVADALGTDKEIVNKPETRNPSVYVPAEKIDVVEARFEKKNPNVFENKPPIAPFPAPKKNEEAKATVIQPFALENEENNSKNNSTIKMIGSDHDSTRPVTRDVKIGAFNSENKSQTFPEVRTEKKFYTGSKIDQLENEKLLQEKFEEAEKKEKQSEENTSNKEKDSEKNKKIEEKYQKGLELEEEKISQPEEHERSHLTANDHEKFGDNTYLFTQPEETPHVGRKKNAEQEVPVFPSEESYQRYSGWIADYYVSGILFFHHSYSRFARHSQAIVSYLLQILLIGVILNGYEKIYIDGKGSDLKSQVKNIVFQDVAVAFTIMLLSNVIFWPFLRVIFKKNELVGDMHERSKTLRMNKFKNSVGSSLLFLMVLGCIIGVTLIEIKLNWSGSLLWLCCIFMAFLFDFFVMQLFKVFLFTCVLTELALP